MSPIKCKLQLAALWVASSLLQVQPATAGETEMYGFAGSHPYLDVILDDYSDIINAFGGREFGRGGSSPKINNITSQWTMGIGIKNTVYNIDDMTFIGASAETGISFARYVLPNGTGIFIEPIVVESRSAFVTGRLFAQARSPEKMFWMQTGIGVLGTQTYEDFYLGTINIKEHRGSTMPFGYMRGTVQFASKVGISLELTQRSSSLMGSLRLEMLR
jgi:hypothetical protein